MDHRATRTPRIKKGPLGLCEFMCASLVLLLDGRPSTGTGKQSLASEFTCLLLWHVPKLPRVKMATNISITWSLVIFATRSVFGRLGPLSICVPRKHLVHKEETDWLQRVFQR